MSKKKKRKNVIESELIPVIVKSKRNIENYITHTAYVESEIPAIKENIVFSVRERKRLFRVEKI